MTLADVRNSIRELDTKKFYRYALLFFIIVIALVGLLAYLQRRRINAFVLRMNRVNKQREVVRGILQEHMSIGEQRAAVDTILNRDKNFKIPQYFEQLVKEAGLGAKMSKTPTVTESDLNNGYEEVQLDTSFRDIDTRQLSELLYKIEKNDRVYTKEVVLIKQPKADKLDVTLVIATLQPRLVPE